MDEILQWDKTKIPCCYKDMGCLEYQLLLCTFISFTVWSCRALPTMQMRNIRGVGYQHPPGRSDIHSNELMLLLLCGWGYILKKGPHGLCCFRLSNLSPFSQIPSMLSHPYFIRCFAGTLRNQWAKLYPTLFWPSGKLEISKQSSILWVLKQEKAR